MESILITNTVTNVKNDWLQFGTMFIVSRILVGESLQGNLLPTTDWVKSIMLLLVGLAAYQIIIVNLISVEKLVPIDYRNLVNNLLKFSTMLIVARLLSGNPLNDPAWIKNLIWALVGFATYDLATVFFISDPQQYSQTKTKKSAIVHDWMQFGTAFTIMRIMSGEQIDAAWLKETAAELIGFAIYDYFAF